MQARRFWSRRASSCAQVERATNLALMAECGQMGEVRLAFCDPALLVAIGDALTAFRQEHRGVRLYLNQMTTLDEIASLGRSTIDPPSASLGPHSTATCRRPSYTSSVMAAMARTTLAIERDTARPLINEPLDRLPAPA